MTALPNKNCLGCSKEIKGRIDKKFCSDYCRNQFNNLHREKMSEFGQTVLKSIRRNRNIMEALMRTSEKMTKAKKEKLLAKGFLFKYHTHQYETKQGNLYTFCFEYGYLALDDNWFLIVKRETE